MKKDPISKLIHPNKNKSKLIMNSLKRKRMGKWQMWRNKMVPHKLCLLSIGLIPRTTIKF